jgi:hypothetical protein
VPDVVTGAFLFAIYRGGASFLGHAADGLEWTKKVFVVFLMGWRSGHDGNHVDWVALNEQWQ